MEVIGFTYESLDGSAAQLIRVYVSHALAHVQKYGSVVKMATEFVECHTELQRSVVLSLWAN
jgi:hypothetical protein